MGFVIFFRFALFLPFLLWAISEFVVKSDDFTLQAMFAFPGVLAAYIIFVAGLLALSFRSNPQQLKLLSLFLPFLFVPLAMIGIQGTVGVSDAGIVDDTIQAFWLSSGFVLMLGYPIVALAWAIYFLLWVCGSLFSRGT